MSKGHLSIPRELYEHSAWLRYTLKDRQIFEFLLSRCMYSPFEYFLSGKRIILQPGQLMTTTRRFADEFNRTVSNDEDTTTKSSIDRFFDRLTRDHFAGHQTVQHAGQKETLITITHPMFYGSTFPLSGTASGTASGTTAGQVRDNIKRTINTDNNDQRSDLIDTHENANDLIFDHKKLGKIEASRLDIIKDLVNLQNTPEEINNAINKMIKQNPCLNGTIQAYIKSILKNKTKKEGKTCQNQEKPNNNFKTESDKLNETYWGKDTSESPLAKFARQNGFK